MPVVDEPNFLIVPYRRKRVHDLNAALAAILREGMVSYVCHDAETVARISLPLSLFLSPSLFGSKLCIPSLPIPHRDCLECFVVGEALPLSRGELVLHQLDHGVELGDVFPLWRRF